MMRDLLIEAAHDIEQAVRHEYGYPDVHPAMHWKYDRDMEIVSRLRATADSLESPPRPEPVAWVAPHNTLYLFDGYEFTIITRRPDGKLSFSGGDDMPENFDDEVGAAGIYRFVGSVHSAEGWTSEQCEAAGIPSDASNYSEWWNGHMEDATLADVAHVFGLRTHPPVRGGEGAEESYWWCDVCSQRVEGRQVTYHEYHDGCGGKVREVTTHSPVPPVVTEAMDRAAWAKIEESCVIEVYDEARVATDVTIVDIHAALLAALGTTDASEKEVDRGE